jgi:hypothetical protein
VYIGIVVVPLFHGHLSIRPLSIEFDLDLHHKIRNLSFCDEFESIQMSNWIERPFRCQMADVQVHHGTYTHTAFWSNNAHRRLWLEIQSLYILFDWMCLGDMLRWTPSNGQTSARWTTNLEGCYLSLLKITTYIYCVLLCDKYLFLIE